MAEISNGVKILLERMASHPEEFYGDALQWRFMFAEKFRDVLTEPEKGMLHEALKNLRRGEFDVLVLRAILRDEEEKAAEEQRMAAELRDRQTQTAKQQAAKQQAAMLQAKQNYQALKQQAGLGNSYPNPLQNVFK